LLFVYCNLIIGICIFPQKVCLFGYISAIMVKYIVLRNEGNTMSTKKETELQSFIDNVNKKDKLNGKKVVFNFVKRKRK
jgi:hypothetical protein